VLSTLQAISIPGIPINEPNEPDPVSAKEWNNEGNALQTMGKFEEAVKCYDQAIAIRPWGVEVWNNKGSALGYLRRFEAAIDCFEKVTEINPSNLIAWKYDGGDIRGASDNGK